MNVPYCSHCKAYLTTICISMTYKHDEEQDFILTDDVVYRNPLNSEPTHQIIYQKKENTKKPRTFEKLQQSQRVICPSCRSLVDMERFGWTWDETGQLVYQNQQMEEML